MAGRSTLARALRGAAVALALSPAAATAGSLDAFVILGPGGAPIARAITDADACPTVTVDGVDRPMALRAAPTTVAQRPTAWTADKSKPSAFAARTCDAPLPRGARTAAIAGRRLSLPAPLVRRIVVIGDTGCRTKAQGEAYQACNDLTRYRFAAIAAHAAAWKPDLVVHVGDLIYRENACAPGHAGCAGSPWGYGLDVWRADFFDPATPLLAAAPWVMTRGNHESCNRAGQGWWRFIDPRPMAPGRDCKDPAQDVTGDYSPPYAVPLGGGAQIVNLDLSNLGETAIPATDPRAGQYREAYADLARLSRPGLQTFALDHYPMLGVAAAQPAGGAVTLRPGNAALRSVFGQDGQPFLPPGVEVLLAGHIHLWQQASFLRTFPTQFVAGFSGTLEDVVPLPPALPAGTEPAPGAHIAQFSSWVDGFGYMTLERHGARAWAATVWNSYGRVVNRCQITGRRSRCDKPYIPPGADAPPS